MRNKEQIMGQLEDMYSKNPNLAERHLISVNMYLEVLIDIRDLCRAFYDRLVDFIEAGDR